VLVLQVAEPGHLHEAADRLLDLARDVPARAVAAQDDVAIALHGMNSHLTRRRPHAPLIALRRESRVAASAVARSPRPISAASRCACSADCTAASLSPRSFNNSARFPRQ